MAGQRESLVREAMSLARQQWESGEGGQAAVGHDEMAGEGLAVQLRMLYPVETLEVYIVR